MNLEIIYQDDTERSEFEAFCKDYRSDIIVKIDNKKYKMYVTSMVRLQQDFELDRDYYGYYQVEPNVVIVNEVTKKEIEYVITELYKGHYFERLDNRGFDRGFDR